MINIKLKNKNYFLAAAIIIAIIVSFYIGGKKIKRMLNNPKFTIGMITSDWHNKTTFKPPGNDYIYYVNRIKFNGVAPTTSKCSNKNIGSRFLVIFDSIKINKSSNLICFYPIPDSIKAPPDGWRLDEVPIEIDMKRIEAYIK